MCGHREEMIRGYRQGGVKVVAMVLAWGKDSFCSSSPYYYLGFAAN